MKQLKKLIENEEALHLLNELSELNKCINSNCYDLYLTKIKTEELESGLQKVKEMLEGDDNE